jgi:serine/threonine protein kinase SCH9
VRPFQLLNRNPKHRLGATRDAAELKEHPFFKSVDWIALAQKQVTPPFKPVVESDESVANFDPEFTSTQVAAANPFEEEEGDGWKLPPGPMSSAHAHDRDGAGGPGGGVAIKQPPKLGKNPLAGSPLSGSVQENFRGFTYSGESTMVGGRSCSFSFAVFN